jgi:hypothetical protein
MKFSRLLLFLFLILFVFFQPVGSQAVTTSPPLKVAIPDSLDAIIAGFVRDSTSGETVIGASVRVRALKLGAVTNKSGYFALHVPSGRNITLEVGSVGYRSATFVTTFATGEERQVTFNLLPSSIQGAEVTVESDREKERQEPQVSRVSLQPSQMSNLPKAGEADLFRILQLLPGVQTASEISSGLYIRGGSPDQNLILLDGSVLYNPSHFFGFFSTFNPDAIKDVELIKGGFPVEYGGRLSAVVSVTNKDGDRNQTNGKLSLGLISSRGTIETPIGSGALSLSGRRTYLDIILDATGLAKELDIPSYHFYDFNGKLTQNPGENDKLSLSGYGGQDKLDYKSDKAGSAIGMNWGNRSGALDWTHVFKSNLFSKLDFHASNYYAQLDAGAAGGEGFTWDNQITDYTLNGSLEYFYQQHHKLKLGFQGSLYQFKFKVQSGNNPPGADLNLKPLYVAGYIQDEWTSDPFAITAGVRLDGITGRSELGFDPRISARYILSPQITLKASVGMYHQYLKLASNPTLSVFDVWLPVDSTQASSYATQYILGLSMIPFEGYILEIEGYYKDMRNLAEIRPGIISGHTLNDVFFLGNGWAYGGEIFLQRQVGNLTGWLGYALAWTRRKFPDINEGETFAPTYDRRNDVNLVLTYRLSDRWNVGTTFVYGTGQAYSQTTAFMQIREPEYQGPLLAIPGKKNSLRLPSYHRLDLSATYSFSLFSDKRNATFDIDIYNVYNHRNTWTRQVDQTVNPAQINDIKLLPILPTFGLQVSF